MMFGERDKDGLDYWNRRWKEDSEMWQLPGVNRLLSANKDVILAGKKNAQVFLPLCGKAHELKWFHDLGHRVVGVEFVEDCVRDYFAENNLATEETTCPVIGCKVFQTPDKTLRIFVCSIFDFKRECAGPMDIVWDRSGYTSIREADRKRYASLMVSLLATNFSYGLWTTVYDAPWYKDSPRSADEEAVRHDFGDAAKITFVDSRDMQHPRFLQGRAKALAYLWHLTPFDDAK